MLGRFAIANPEPAYAELFLFVTPNPGIDVLAAFVRPIRFNAPSGCPAD
jgi:hypothetical protein